MRKQGFWRLPKIIYVLLIPILFFTNSMELKSQGQTNYTVTITIFEPLPELDWAAFLYIENIRNIPAVFRVQISPQGGTIILKLILQWEKNVGQGFQDLFWLETVPFKVAGRTANFTNNMLGTGELKVNSFETNASLVEELRRIGKLAGNFQLIGQAFEVLDDGTPGNKVGEGSADFTVTNPSQTLSILSPDDRSFQDPLVVMANWTDLIGASNYRVNANVVKDPNQSNEEAMKSGTKYIDADVGLSTVVNLYPLLQREWKAGDHIVLQVIADIAGPGGGSKRYSNFIRFTLMGVKEDWMDLASNVFEEILLVIDDEAMFDFLNRLKDGSLVIHGIRRSDGKPLTPDEVTRLLEYLKNNPEAIIRFNKN
jgi:hypothetical protein